MVEHIHMLPSILYIWNLNQLLFESWNYVVCKYFENKYECYVLQNEYHESKIYIKNLAHS